MNQDNLQDLLTWYMQEQQNWCDLATSDNLEEAVYPDHVFLYPYQPSDAPGIEVRMQVWFENIFKETTTLDYRLVLPEGWSTSPDSGSLAAEPGNKATLIILRIPTSQWTT